MGLLGRRLRANPPSGPDAVPLLNEAWQVGVSGGLLLGSFLTQTRRSIWLFTWWSWTICYVFLGRYKIASGVLQMVLCAWLFLNAAVEKAPNPFMKKHARYNTKPKVLK